MTIGFAGCGGLASAGLVSVSYYGPGFHGRQTANGERFDAGAYTVAHRSLPFGTRVYFRNPKNGRSVVVRVNDRGPFVGGREFDLSHAAAKALGVTKEGVATVEYLIMTDDSA